MNFIKKNYIVLLIGILILIILLQRCNGNNSVAEKPRVKIDTVWIKHDSIVYSKPKVIKVIKGIKEIQYVPDTSYTKLVIQYKDLVDLYTAQNVFSDTLRIDSIGYVNVKDTITKNIIKGRSYNYNLKYPVVTKTITLQPTPKTQVYVGGGLQGDQYSMINEFSTGLLLKTKQDQIFGLYTGIDNNGRIQYGLQSYWKIKLHK